VDEHEAMVVQDASANCWHSVALLDRVSVEG